MVQEFIMFVGQESDNMTHKEYLQKVNTIEFAVHGPEKEVALDDLERKWMKSLEENLDIEWVKNMALEEFDEELENEYGDLF